MGIEIPFKSLYSHLLKIPSHAVRQEVRGYIDEVTWYVWNKQLDNTLLFPGNQIENYLGKEPRFPSSN